MDLGQYQQHLKPAKAANSSELLKRILQGLLYNLLNRNISGSPKSLSRLIMVAQMATSDTISVQCSLHEITEVYTL